MNQRQEISSFQRRSWLHQTREQMLRSLAGFRPHRSRRPGFIRYAGALVRIRGRLADPTFHREVPSPLMARRLVNSAEPSLVQKEPIRRHSYAGKLALGGQEIGAPIFRGLYRRAKKESAAVSSWIVVEACPQSSQSRKALRPQGPGVQPRRGLLFMRLFGRDGNLPGTVCPALLPIRHNRRSHTKAYCRESSEAASSAAWEATQKKIPSCGAICSWGLLG